MKQVSVWLQLEKEIIGMIIYRLAIFYCLFLNIWPILLERRSVFVRVEKPEINFFRQIQIFTIIKKEEIFSVVSMIQLQ